MNIVVTGAAGLVGQNLIPRLKTRAAYEIVAIDKHAGNIRTLRDLHPDLTIIEADLAAPGHWTTAIDRADTIVIAHAQIGGLAEEQFTRNNVIATQRLLDAIAPRGPRHLVHISSSVVNSAAVDWYTESKKQQETLVMTSGNPCVVLRPTLMFGWFDRKHLGWLARFMQRSPVFPVPGHGRYLRQPLYAGDLCKIIVACIDRQISGKEYNISGQTRIDFIDLIRLVRNATRSRTLVVKTPYSVFWTMLKIYALFDRDPPFTVKQLQALVTSDTFEVIDWPRIFDVDSTPLEQAIEETFRHPRYSSVALEF